MEYVNLGKSGLKVCVSPSTHSASLALILQISKIILGCMTYGSAFKWMISDEQEAIKHMKYAYDQGINVSIYPKETRLMGTDFRHGKCLQRWRERGAPREDAQAA